MSKYDALAAWLARSSSDRVEATFADIDRVLGFALPPSGRQYQAFWSDPTVAGPLARVGWRAQWQGAAGKVRFIRVGVPRPTSSASERAAADVILLGCVKTKRDGWHRAKDLYVSTLFDGRRRYAEQSGRPWFILSAKLGLVKPDD